MSQHDGEWLRLALEAGELGSWEHDLQTGAFWQSDRYHQILGHAPPGAGWSFGDLHRQILPEDHHLIAEALETAGVTGAPYRVDFRIRRDDGELRWIDGRGSPVVDEAGAIVRVVGTIADITDRKRIETDLEARVAERTAQLEAANAALQTQIAERERVEATLRQMQRLEAVSQLTSGVAHDFNNLLTVILGNVELIAMAMDDPRLAARLGHVRSAAERGAALTRQLLAFSRRQHLAPKALDLNQAIEGMEALIRSTIGGKMRLQTRLHPGLWPALVDPTQIELVVLNLAINARDAMGIGGDLTLSTANVSLVAAPRGPEEPGPGDYVVVSVIDTGSGMDDATLAKAFEPFFTTKGVGQGSGLGLSQVLGFAQQSGGGVRIDTHPGKGTSVQVFLPRAQLV